MLIKIKKLVLPSLFLYLQTYNGKMFSIYSANERKIFLFHIILIQLHSFNIGYIDDAEFSFNNEISLELNCVTLFYLDIFIYIYTMGMNFYKFSVLIYKIFNVN